MVVASNDRLTVADLALTAYERALEPKRLALARAAISIPISTSFRSRKPPQRDGSPSICLSRHQPCRSYDAFA